jgi:hypothetical protein
MRPAYQPTSKRPAFSTADRPMSQIQAASTTPSHRSSIERLE